MARIVFDLDGTLIDAARDIQGVANAVLEGEGAAPLTPEETRSFIGNGSPVFVARMRAARGIPDAAQERLLAGFMERYEAAVSLTQTYPGVEAALQALRDAGHVLGICTNKPIRPCRAVLEHLQLDGFFDAVLGGDSLPVHKPDPAPLHAAFAVLGDGLRVFVGDSEVDGETAVRAQVPFLLFSEGFARVPLAEIPNDGVFSAFADLPGLVAGILARAG